MASDFTALVVADEHADADVEGLKRSVGVEAELTPGGLLRAYPASLPSGVPPDLVEVSAWRFGQT